MPNNHTTDPAQMREELRHESQTILNRATHEKRDLTKDEQERFDEIMGLLATAETEEFVRRARESRGRLAGPQLGDGYSARQERRIVLGREDSVEAHFRAMPQHQLRGPLAEMSAGEFLRAAVLGPVTPEQRTALSESTDSAGGFTLPVPLAGYVIDRLRPQSAAFRAGASIVPMLMNTLSIARVATDPVAAWRLEAGTVASSDMTFERVTFTARSLAVIVLASRELIEDSQNANDALLNALTKALALELDRVAFFGTGTAPEPKGISTTSGVGSVDMGTNGAALTSYDEVLDAVQALADANAQAPTAAVMAPRTATAYAKLKDSTDQPLRRPQMIETLPFITSTQFPVNETHGTAVNASRFITGYYPDLLIGVRAGIRIEVLRERYADTMQLGFLAHVRADVQLAHAASFSQIVGIIP